MRSLDSTLGAHIDDSSIAPVYLAEITFKSGVERVWSGVGPLVWNGNTFSGVGELGSVGPIGEGSSVKADGTTITLSGIGDSQLDIPPGRTGLPAPPLPVPDGQSFVWAIATQPPTPGSFSVAPSVFNSYLGNSGASGGDATSGFVTLTNGNPLGEDSIGALWGGYELPPEVPQDAVIAAVHPYVVVSSLSAGGAMSITCGDIQLGLGPGPILGPNIGALSGQTIAAGIYNPLEGAAGLAIDISFVGMAVYYIGTPKTKLTLLNEALNDIQLGAPVKIWVGLWNTDACALYGNPYLQFAGTVDKPTVKIGRDTTSITLALENRLVNLQRANQRRYTAADQHLKYPDDTGFNSVEALNDIALRWGS